MTTQTRITRATYQAWVDSLPSLRRAEWLAMAEGDCPVEVMADWAEDNGGMRRFSEWSRPLTDNRMADMSPWDIAERLGIGYSGDMNPVQHGGFFYDTRDWDAWGYASCIEFWEDPETHNLIVQRGTINRSHDMTDAFLCCDIPEEEQGNIHAQIEACKGYRGMEPDDTTDSSKRFNLDTWKKEWRIWRSIRGWIESLGS